MLNRGGFNSRIGFHGAGELNRFSTVNDTVGAGTVTGTITTDGTLGILHTANIIDWDLVLKNGFGTTLDLTGPSAAAPVEGADVVGSDLTASAQSLSFNFSATDGGFFVIQENGLFNGGTYFCDGALSQANCTAGGESDFPGVLDSSNQQFAARSGNVTLGVRKFDGTRTIYDGRTIDAGARVDFLTAQQAFTCRGEGGVNRAGSTSAKSHWQDQITERPPPPAAFASGRWGSDESGFVRAYGVRLTFLKFIQYNYVRVAIPIKTVRYQALTDPVLPMALPLATANSPPVARTLIGT